MRQSGALNSQLEAQDSVPSLLILSELQEGKIIDEIENESDWWQAGNRVSVEVGDSERSPNIHQRSGRLPLGIII